jgi:LysR family transcriptional regulator, low CO2-responsive transcriptional regulator
MPALTSPWHDPRRQANQVSGEPGAAQQAVREVSAGESRELRIAAVTTAAEHLLPALLGGFTRGNAGVRLAIDVGNRERVFRRLAAHEADVAIAGRAPPDAGLVSARFRDNTMVVITQPGDPLAAGASVDLAELADRTWLLREEGSGTRAYNEALIARLDLRPRILTLGSNGAIKAAVRAGLGVAALSRDAVALELDAHLLVTVAVAGLPQREWFAHRASVGPVRPAVAEFLTYLERCG